MVLDYNNGGVMKRFLTVVIVSVLLNSCSINVVDLSHVDCVNTTDDTLLVIFNQYSLSGEYQKVDDAFTLAPREIHSKTLRSMQYVIMCEKNNHFYSRIDTVFEPSCNYTLEF